MSNTENPSGKTGMVSVPERLEAPDMGTGHPEAGRAFATAFYKERARADALSKLLSQPAEQHQGEPAAGPWREGEPPHPWNSEWFLARMKQGHIVVLRPLPEEYAHDYATADETYVMRESIVQWAQLSLSSYVAPQDSHADPGEVERLRANAGQHKRAMDAASGEIEILRAQLADLKQGLESQVVEGLRADANWLRAELDKALLQQAVRDALLHRWVGNFGHLGGCATPLRDETKAALSASAEPSPPNFEKHIDLIWRLHKIGTHETGHVLNGSCPDEIEGHAARDNDCPACQALMDADELLVVKS